MQNPMNGHLGANEVKFGTKWIEQGAKNLLALKAKIDTDVMNQPSFLMVITGGEYAYLRDDVIYVVPLCCLKD